MTAIIFIIFLGIVAGLGIFTTVLFYHIGRYSYIGDSSKRVFIYYVATITLIVILAFIAMVSNHILN